MSKSQVAHNMKVQGGFLPLLAGLASQALPFLTGTVLPALGVGALSGLASTHSLTVLHIERSWPAIQAAPTDRPTSSSTCCSQFLRGRPGGRFQSAAGGVPVWASIDS